MPPHRITPLISESRIQSRIREIAARIASDAGGVELLLIGVLEGARPFAADLRKILPAADLDWIRVVSYKGTSSTRSIREARAPRKPIRGRHCLLVEDIVDSGRTLNYLVKRISREQPASLRSCALLDKPSRRVMRIHADYIGFDIPDEFVVGYGMDLDHQYRDLPYIGFVED